MTVRRADGRDGGGEGEGGIKEPDLSTRTRRRLPLTEAVKRGRWVRVGTTTSGSVVSQGPADPHVRKSRSLTLCLGRELRIGKLLMCRGGWKSRPPPPDFSPSLWLQPPHGPVQPGGSLPGPPLATQHLSTESSIIFSWTVTPFRI